MLQLCSNRGDVGTWCIISFKAAVKSGIFMSNNLPIKGTFLKSEENIAVNLY